MTKEEDSRNILIGESRLCGKGVFAARVLEKGETILEFTGNEIDVEQALNKGEKSGNPLQVGPDLYVDLEPPGVFINHSCDPNTGILNNRTLIALRKIHQGEEIFYDYSTTMGDGLWTMNCLCGTQKCRGIITDFRHLPPPPKEPIWTPVSCSPTSWKN